VVRSRENYFRFADEDFCPDGPPKKESQKMQNLNKILKRCLKCGRQVQILAKFAGNLSRSNEGNPRKKGVSPDESR